MQPLFTKKKISNQIINCTPTFSVFFFRKFKFLNFPLFFSYFTIFEAFLFLNCVMSCGAEPTPFPYVMITYSIDDPKCQNNC